MHSDVADHSCCVGSCAFALTLIAINLYLHSAYPALALTGLALYFVFFSLGMGPGAWSSGARSSRAEYEPRRCPSPRSPTG